MWVQLLKQWHHYWSTWEKTLHFQACSSLPGSESLGLNSSSWVSWNSPTDCGDLSKFEKLCSMLILILNTFSWVLRMLPMPRDSGSSWGWGGCAGDCPCRWGRMSMRCHRLETPLCISTCKWPHSALHFLPAPPSSSSLPHQPQSWSQKTASQKQQI